MIADHTTYRYCGVSLLLNLFVNVTEINEDFIMALLLAILTWLDGLKVQIVQYYFIFSEYTQKRKLTRAIKLVTYIASECYFVFIKLLERRLEFYLPPLAFFYLGFFYVISYLYVSSAILISWLQYVDLIIEVTWS